MCPEAVLLRHRLPRLRRLRLVLALRLRRLLQSPVLAPALLL
jgi:hypothetical protein